VVEFLVKFSDHGKTLIWSAAAS